MVSALEKEFAAACRGRQISLVLFDLDRFKLYINTFGRLAGDEALIRFAQILRGETRSMNLAARFGGEEFAAILSATGIEGARIYADRIRLRVAEKSGGRLTVSAGIAEYRPWMRTPADLVAAADQALYRAKSAGRNQIDTAED